MQLFHIPTTPAGNAAGVFVRRKMPTDELLVDEQTFKDLEVFEAVDRGPSLFDWFNRTRTSGGSRVLQARWQHPSNEIMKIRETQASVRHVADNPNAFIGIPADGVVTGVEHYIYCGLPVITDAGRIELFLQAVESRLDDDRSYWKRVVGIQRVTETVVGMRQIAEHPAQKNAPGEIRVLLERLRILLADPAIASLPDDENERLPFWRVMQLDRSLRHLGRVNIEHLLQIIFEIDAIVSMGLAFNDRHLVMPDIVDGDTEIGGVDVYHPFVQNPVPNPLRVDQRSRLLFVTGPNMAGKTTYLRACGICAYLAHLGMGVPARSFRFTPADSLFTAISLSDSVRAGVSFFQAEAMRFKAIAQALSDQRRVIALLDEPFMGTNVKDALDASSSILTRLTTKTGSVFIVSSHLIELAEGLVATENAVCCRFEAGEDEHALTFDYRLRPGVSSQRLGMRVLREHGVFALLE